jgi:hypothetical protein
MKKQSGKQSENSRITKPVTVFERKLPRPPETLTEPEKTIWQDVVASPAGAYIGVESFPVLVEYCEAVVYSRQIGQEVRHWQVQWADTEEGLKRWDKLLAMKDRAAARAANLAVKLRLTPSTRKHGRTAAVAAERTIPGGVPPWKFGEEMEDSSDD